jgi:glucokinase
MAFVVAADIGGTYLRAALVDGEGRVTAKRRAPTPAESPASAVLAAIGDLLEGVASEATEPVLAGCVAVPGLVNADEGKVILAPNIAAFRNLVLTTPMRERLGFPMVIENDASAAALGEHRFGAGKGTRHLLHATAGTGIGGGIVIDGHLYRGAKGFAGEIGHIVIEPAGPRCNCGSRGCLEAVVSGVALANRARQLLAKGQSDLLAEISAGREPTGADLFAAAEQGDLACEAEIRHGGHLLGLGLGSLVNVLNPDAVTLSGGLLVMGEMFLGPMREALFSVAYGAAGGTELRLSALGDDAGLLGAAAVAFEFAELSIGN